MHFLVLNTQPNARPTGEVTVSPRGEETRWHKVVNWKELGLLSAPDAAAALQQAKAQWGGSPVIAQVSSH